MAARRNNSRGATIDLATFQAVAGMMGLVAPAPAPATKATREQPVEKTAVVLSVHEIGLLVQAIETGENVSYSVDEQDPGRRASKVVILDDVNAAKYRGRYQVIREITGRGAAKQTPEQEELARVKAELAALKAVTPEVAPAE